MKEHLYQIDLKWTGDRGKGTSSYRSYDRAYEIKAEGKAVMFGSSDPVFRGDRTKYNPEELFVASIASCHMLWYLHLCADAEVVTLDYSDLAIGKMSENQDGSGRFAEVILKPKITIAHQSNLELAKQLHQEAHKFCFIANSVNFPVFCQPSISWHS